MKRLIKRETKGSGKRDGCEWARSDSVCLVDGRGYCVAPTGRSYCIGLVDAEGNPPKAIDAMPRGEDVVSKLPEDESIGDKLTQAENGDSYETIKHPGGRPRKDIAVVSRVTKWRRAKEKQGVFSLGG
jgi:hypothetical protein